MAANPSRRFLARFNQGVFGRRGPTAVRTFKPRVEALEDRLVMANHIWIDNPFPTSLWSSPLNWIGGVPKMGEANLTLEFNSGLAVTNNNIGDLTVSGIKFTNGPGFVLTSLSKFNLTLTDGAVVRDEFNDPSPPDSQNHRNSISMNLNLAGTVEFDVVYGGETLFLTGVVSGDQGSLKKTEGGTLELDNNNSYLGQTEVVGGTLLRNSDNSINVIPDASAVVVHAGATFDVNNTDEHIGSLAGDGNVSLGTGNAGHSLFLGGDNSKTTFSGVISGTGSIVKEGKGAMTLAGAVPNTYTGATTISTGDLQLQSPDQIPDSSPVIVNKTGNLLMSLGFPEVIGSLAGDGKVLLGKEFLRAGGNDQSTAFGGVISGPGGLVKQGSGILTLSVHNTYQGGTFIDAGVLELGGADALDDAGLVSLLAGATLRLNGFSDTIGSLEGAGTVDLGKGNLTMGDAGNHVFGGAINGSGGITKNGKGALTLISSQSYGAQTIVNQGTLRLDVSGGLPDTGDVTVNADGTLDLNNLSDVIGALAGSGQVKLGSASLTTGGNNHSTVFKGVISGSGGLVKKGSLASMTLAGANTYHGATTIDAGELLLGAANVIDDVSPVSILAGAQLKLNDFNETIASLTGAGMVDLGAGNLAVGVNGKSATYDGTLTGAGTVTKVGGGILTLTGVSASPYTGGTIIQAGTVRLGAAGVLASAGRVEVGEGAVFDLNNFNATIGGLTMTGGTVTTGTGVLALGGIVTATSTATPVKQEATISGKLSLGFASRAFVVANGPLDTDLNLSAQITFGFATDGLIKQGAGALKLSGANDYRGQTAIEAGSIVAGASEVLPDGAAVTVAAGASLNLNNFNETIGSLAGAGNLSLGSGFLVTGGDDSSTSVTGTISGSGGLTKIGAGTLTLSGTNNYTGVTLIRAGKLVVNGAQQSSPISVGAGSLSPAPTPALIAGGSLGGTGTVGPITFAEPPTGSGSLVPDGGLLGPGASPGILTSGNIVFKARSIFKVELNGTNAGSQFDQLNVTGTVNLGGATLNVALGYTPAVGDTYKVINNDSNDPIVGVFAGLPEGYFINQGNSRRLQISYVGGDGNDVVLRFLSPNRGYIQSLYWLALNRAASNADLDAWENVLNRSGRSPVANSIQRSTEALGLVVDSLYLKYLNRGPDTGGRSYWVGRFQGGDSVENLVIGFVSSDEYFNRAPSVPGVGGGAPSNVTLVKAVYLQLLGRLPSDADITYWTGQIQTTGRFAVSTFLLHCDEYRANFVKSYYLQLLHRSTLPTAGEINGWVRSNLDQLSMMIVFEGTDEFFQNGG